VNEKIKEVSGMNREETLEYKKKESSGRVPFVLTFHPRLRQLGTVLRKHFHLIQRNERLRKAFPDTPIVAFRRQQNLKDMLVHTGTRKDVKVENTVKSCKDARCKCCSHLKETEEFSINDQKHIVRSGGTCKSGNVIYAIRCRICNLWYIGESGLKLHSRLNGHRSSIKRLQKGEKLNTQYTDTGCAEHFVQKGHNFDSDAELHLLEKGEWTEPSERKQRESFFICKFGMLNPKGMNKSSGTLSDFYGKI
jgi:hypothetical protein